METKICRKCNEDKPLASYWKHKTTADGFYNICKSCEAIKRKPKNAEYSKKWRREQFVKHFYGNVRGNAENKGLEFSIPFEIWEERFKEADTCPLLGIPLVKTIGSNRNRKPEQITVDRIENSKGYTAENFWFVSWRANRLKSDASLEELKLLTSNLEKHMLTK